MRRPLFTAEELEEIRLADEEIEREFAQKSRKTQRTYRANMSPEAKAKKRAYDAAYKAARKRATII